MSTSRLDTVLTSGVVDESVCGEVHRHVVSRGEGIDQSLLALVRVQLQHDHDNACVGDYSCTNTTAAVKIL